MHRDKETPLGVIRGTTNVNFEQRAEVRKMLLAGSGDDEKESSKGALRRPGGKFEGE